MHRYWLAAQYVAPAELARKVVASLQVQLSLLPAARSCRIAGLRWLKLSIDLISCGTLDMQITFKLTTRQGANE